MSAAVAEHERYLRQSYYPALDGLRAVSMLLVITVHLFAHQHVWRWLSGARGVTIFFVLSGYLITTLALREERRRGRLELGAFYVRRAFRLFPLYYLILGVYLTYFLVLGMGRPEQQAALAEALPWFACYLQEIPYFRLMVLQGQPLPFEQCWSLGVEEKFYLIWPLLAFVLWRARPQPRLLGTAVLALALGAVTPFARMGDPAWQAFARNPLYYHQILVGCLLALVLDDPRLFARARWLLGQGWLLTVLFLAVHLAEPWLDGPPRLLARLLYPLLTAGLLACLVLNLGPAPHLLAWRPLAFAGQLSYAGYLVHLLVLAVVYRAVPGLLTGPAALSVAAVALAATGSLLAAWVLRVTIEQPGIRLGRWLSERLQGEGGGLPLKGSEPALS